MSLEKNECAGSLPTHALPTSTRAKRERVAQESSVSRQIQLAYPKFRQAHCEHLSPHLSFSIQLSIASWGDLSVVFRYDVGAYDHCHPHLLAALSTPESIYDLIGSCNAWFWAAPWGPLRDEPCVHPGFSPISSGWSSTSPAIRTLFMTSSACSLEKSQPSSRGDRVHHFRL